MNLYQAQEYAKDVGYDSARFIALFPIGPKTCKWLDAYFGFFTIEGEDLDGFLSVREMDKIFPNLICEPIDD